MPTTAPRPRTLADAMTAHPEMVSGERRSDLALMRAGRGDWVPRSAPRASRRSASAAAGSGIAVKVADGAKRGLHPATVAVLDQLGLLDADARAGALAHGASRPSATTAASSRATSRPVVVLDNVGVLGARSETGHAA